MEIVVEVKPRTLSEYEKLFTRIAENVRVGWYYKETSSQGQLDAITLSSTPVEGSDIIGDGRRLAIILSFTAGVMSRFLV